MKTTGLTSEELQILDDIESGRYRDVDDTPGELQKLEKIAQYNLSKRKSINIRPLEVDIRRVKAKAAEQGIPYQTLINAVIHQYANDKLIQK